MFSSKFADLFSLFVIRLHFGESFQCVYFFSFFLNSLAFFVCFHITITTLLPSLFVCHKLIYYEFFPIIKFFLFFFFLLCFKISSKWKFKSMLFCLNFLIYFYSSYILVIFFSFVLIYKCEEYVIHSFKIAF